MNALLASAANSAAQWRKMMVPDHPGWTKNILLIIIWMFVLAVLIGSLYRFVRQRRRSATRQRTDW